MGLDAGCELLELAVARLVGQLRVGDGLTAEGHEVGALIGAGGDKGAEEVAVGAVDLYHVYAGELSAARRVAIANLLMCVKHKRREIQDKKQA